MSEIDEKELPLQIGTWHVIRLLGKGGMAEVYEVEDVRLGSRYALKLFTYDRGSCENVKERFYAEGRLLAKLDHPRLVRVYEVGEDSETGRPYFVMDLVLDPEGRPRTLADAGAAGSDEDQVAMWYEDLRSGLEYIHAREILHRDLKLQNVLIGADGHAVLSDFGVAKIFNTELRESIGLTAEMTLFAGRGGKQTVMGSVGYMAPEVEMGVAASKESDWYALGVLIFNLLTGVWCDSRTDIVSDLETYNPVWKEILPKLLHANPAGRSCPSWKEKVQILHEREALETEKAHLVIREKLRRAKSAKKILIPVCVVALVALALCVGLISKLLYSHNRGSGDLDFGKVIEIPKDAPRNEGAQPSYEQFCLARIDAWVFLNNDFEEFSKGETDILNLASRMMNLAKLAENEEIEEDKESGIPSYMRVGENDPLALLLYRGAERLFRKETLVSEATQAASAAEKILKRRREENL